MLTSPSTSRPVMRPETRGSESPPRIAKDALEHGNGVTATWQDSLVRSEGARICCDFNDLRGFRLRAVFALRAAPPGAAFGENFACDREGVSLAYGSDMAAPQTRKGKS